MSGKYGEYKIGYIKKEKENWRNTDSCMILCLSKHKIELQNFPTCTAFKDINWD